jgi:hypothetical protein
MTTMKDQNNRLTKVPELTCKEWFLHPSNIKAMTREVNVINQKTKRWKFSKVFEIVPDWMEEWANKPTSRKSSNFDHELWEVSTPFHLRIVKIANSYFLKDVSFAMGYEDVSYGKTTLLSSGEYKECKYLTAQDMQNLELRPGGALYENPLVLGMDRNRNRIGNVYYPGQKYMHKRNHNFINEDGLSMPSFEHKPSGYNQRDLLSQSWAPYA